jgi:hypothetical protein
MSNLSDKEIDRLSREAADSYEPSDSSLSWSRLEQKLAQQMPERPPDGFRFGRINPYIWGPAVILLAGASFFFIKNVIYSSHSTRNIQTINQSVSIPGADSKNASGNAIRLDSNMVVQSAADGENGQSSETDQKSALSARSETDADTRNLSGSAASNNLYANPNAGSGNNLTGTKRSASKAHQSGAVIAAGSIETNRSVSAEDQNKPETNGMAESTGAAEMNGHAQINDQLHLPFVITRGTGLGKVSGNDSLMNQLARSKTPIHQKSLHLNRSLNIGFTFGPDYTNAGGIANNQIGNNIGLTLGYYLTDKLSINTGIIYSNRFYWSKAHNYFFQQPVNTTQSFAAPPPIDYINGASNIWELPLTLRFDFAHHNKTRFFANAGLSSYFMMKQTYIYFLHSGQNQLAYKISDNQQVNYWFGIADISAGFEAEIGKGFSFQAEPFLKLPLRNMGMEDLKLTSYGFLMTFKYAPVLSRSKK